MSELISGANALIAIANKKEVQYEINDSGKWHLLNTEEFNIHEVLNSFDGDNRSYKFRLKPKTITLNNNELPKPISIAWGDPHKTAVELDFKNEDEAHEFHRLFSSLFL